MQCVILAGGLATRMRPLTEKVPKALLPVLGVPFLDHQLHWLSHHGVTEVLLLVGHQGEQIEAYAKDGARWGLKLHFSYESGPLLGTGGALRLAYDRKLLQPAFLLTYGDSYLRVDFAEVFRKFQSSKLPALMTVFHNRDSLDSSNAILENGLVTYYSKQPHSPPSERPEYIDYGLLALQDSVIELLPSGEKHDLSQLLELLAGKKQLAGLEVFERFYEIGSPAGLQDLEEYLRHQGANQT